MLEGGRGLWAAWLEPRLGFGGAALIAGARVHIDPRQHRVDPAHAREGVLEADREQPADPLAQLELLWHVHIESRFAQRLHDRIGHLLWLDLPELALVRL